MIEKINMDRKTIIRLENMKKEYGFESYDEVVKHLFIAHSTLKSRTLRGKL